MILGIDPGITGAIAVLRDDGSFIGVWDMPTMHRNKTDNKQQINVAELDRMLKTMTSSAQGVVRFIIERVYAAPKSRMGLSMAVMFGKTAGHIEACIICQGMPVEFVMPGSWKKHLKLGKDKEHSRAYAQQLYPQAPLGHKKDHNRAEAILLARWYLQQQAQAQPLPRRQLTKRSRA